MVFKTLVDPDRLNRYMGTNSNVQAEVGGDYEIGWGDEGPVKILEIEADKKLCYSWQYPNTPDTVVTWTLEGSGGSTHLTLVHSGFAEDRPMEDYQIGWLKYLGQIKFLSELGESWQKVIATVNDF